MSTQATPDSLALLHDLARLLETSSDLSNTLNQALALLASHLGMMRGAITLINPLTGKIRIEAAYGLNAAQRKRGSYLPGEGITGRVIASGQPMLIRDAGKEPLFLNRTRSRDLAHERITFLCVPIRLDGQVVGALSLDQHGDRNFERELELLEIIAALLAHTAYESGGHGVDHSWDRERPQGFVGNSESMRQVYTQIAMVAPTPTTVFLQGESGTGKELVARAIHNGSSHANGSFVSLNCAALPESLVESELFGHERGAFTGATQTRKGRFELSRGGTLFLDEIGEISLPVQAKLLRVLQERSFERLGGMETLYSDARLITATNRDLAKMVEEGCFRRDLYYRLNVFAISLPPLRQRQEDILPLASHFLDRFARAAGKKAPRLSLAAIDILQRYDWPGNIRELQNVMERSIVFLGRENLLMPQHLPENLRGGRQAGSADANRMQPLLSALDSRLEEIERASIIEALASCAGRQNRAAAMLGISERIFGLRLKKYGIDYKKFRN